MFVGRLKHNIFEIFSKREKELVLKIDRDYEKIDLVMIYETFLSQLTDRIFLENAKAVEGFRIAKEDFFKELKKNFIEDIKLRVNSISEKTRLGFFRETLWNSLDKIYVSELNLKSENLGLKGRVDRIEISRQDKKITPYELKTRGERFFLSDEIQLTAYAMLLEDYYKTKIDKGILEASGIKKEIPITDENKTQVMRIAEQIRNLNGSSAPQMLSNFNKCKSCIFNEFCADI
jgi:CRISPR-associated protein Cas4